MKPMHFLKALGGGLSSAALKFCLFSFAVTFAFVSVFGAADSLKQSVKQSNLYNTAVDSVLDGLAQSPQSEASDKSIALPLDNPQVRVAAKNSFPPGTLETWGDQFIDGLYGWLEGITNRPEFQIDITNQRQAFAGNVSNIVGERLENLPACSRQESLRLAQEETIDLFTIPCRPPVNINQEKARLRSEVERSTGFIGDNIVNADDLTHAEPGKDPFNDSSAPQIFQWAKRLPTITVTLAIVSILALLLLADDKHRAFKKISRVFMGIGLFLLLSTLLFGYLFGRSTQPDGAINNLQGIEGNGLQPSLIEIATSLFRAFNTKLIYIAVIYILIGGGIWLTLRFRRAPIEKPTSAHP